MAWQAMPVDYLEQQARQASPHWPQAPLGWDLLTPPAAPCGILANMPTLQGISNPFLVQWVSQLPRRTWVLGQSCATVPHGARVSVP